MRRHLTAGVALVIALLAMVAAVGCGGDGSSDETQAEAPGAAATEGGEAEGGGGGGGGAASAVTIKMGDFFFDPKTVTIKAPKGGAVTISAPNKGKVEHELVLFKTDANPASLPTAADGGVDEEKLDKQAQEAGEIADVEPGDSKSGKFEMSPGRYVMFCNVPGHYAQGMYGTVVVK